MGLITKTAEEIMQPLTPEELKEIEDCRNAPIALDDIPEIPPEELAHFRRRKDILKERREMQNQVVVQLTPDTMSKAKEIGVSNLSKLVQMALNDTELLKRYKIS